MQRLLLRLCLKTPVMVVVHGAALSHWMGFYSGGLMFIRI
jgi:hypothetical protein